MIVHMVWPDCDFQNGRWSNTPIDSFWVECTPAEVASQVLPRLSPQQREQLDDLHRQQAEPAATTFVLVAQDLSLIEPMESHYPYGNLWNAYSPFREIVPRTIERLEDVVALDVIALLPLRLLDEVAEERGAWRRCRMVDVAVEGLVHSEHELCHVHFLSSRGPSAWCCVRYAIGCRRDRLLV